MNHIIYAKQSKSKFTVDCNLKVVRHVHGVSMRWEGFSFMVVEERGDSAYIFIADILTKENTDKHVWHEHNVYICKYINI